LRIAGAEVSVEGEHDIPAGACVFIYNESSLLDLVLLQRYVYEHADTGVAAEVFARLPWARAAFARSGIEIFQRGDRAAAERMLATVTVRVARGARLAMGGEGRLTPGGGVGHFKRGACLVAIRAGAPIVPVALSGGPALMALGSLRLRPGKLGVRYGAPVSTAGWSEADAERLAAEVRAAVVALRG
jgi:1-acyl-sn-glycerol-3-phosphate acyltransferase